jgi:phage-related protein
MGLMGTSFDVTAILKANVKPFNSGMKEAQMTLQSLKNQTGTTLDKLSGSLSAVGTASMKIGAGLTAGLTTPVVGAIGGIVKSFADLEQNLGGTEVVFGSFAKTVQNDAQTAYKNMGLSASDYMATANKMASLFQGSGISQQKSLDLTSQAMQRAADVASVMGIDTSMAMESIAGAAKGNFTMMDNLGVAMNATTLEAYALEKGLNFKWETASNAEKAELAMQMFMDRTKQFDGNFLKESEKTVSGSLGAMKSAFQNFVAGLGNPEADIKQLMANLKTTIENFAKNVKTVLLTIWDNLPLEPWQKWLGLIAVSAGPALIAIGGVISVIGKLVGTISFIAGAVSKVSAWFTLLNSGGSALSVTFAKIVGVVSSLGAPFLVVIAVIASLIAILVGVYNTSEEFRNKVNSAFEAVRSTVTSAIQEVVSFVMELFGTLISWWNENHALFEQTATTVWNAIKTVVETVTNFLAPFIEATWNNIVSVVSAAWDILKVVIETALNIILGIIKVVMQLINGDWSGAWETIKETVGKVWDGIKKIIDIAINSVWNVIQTGWEGIKNIVSATLEFIKSLVQSGWNRVLSIITSIGAFIISAVKTAFNNAVAGARNFISNAYNVGKNLILGFVNGVKNAASALINSVTNVVSGAINGAKRLLGIHSPSRVFRQFGEYTDEGFIIGVNNRAGAVMKSVGNMAQGAINAFTGKDLAGNLQSELGAVDGELGRLSGYNTSVDFNGGTITVGQQSANIILKMGNTTYRAFTEDITSAQEMELTLATNY